MAANTELSTAASLPAIAYDASVPTTWQRFDLPTQGNPSKATVQATGACFVAFEADGAVDGAAVGNNKFDIDATNAAGGVSFNLSSSRAQRSTFICVAAQATTITDVRVMAE